MDIYCTPERLLTSVFEASLIHDSLIGQVGDVTVVPGLHRIGTSSARDSCRTPSLQHNIELVP